MQVNNIDPVAHILATFIIMIFFNNLSGILRSMIEKKKKRKTKSNSHFFHKKTLKRQMGNLDQFAPNYLTLYFIICSINIWEILSRIMGVQYVDKCNIQIYQKVLF